MNERNIVASVEDSCLARSLADWFELDAPTNHHSQPPKRQQDHLHQKLQGNLPPRSSSNSNPKHTAGKLTKQFISSCAPIVKSILSSAIVAATRRLPMASRLNAELLLNGTGKALPGKAASLCRMPDAEARFAIAPSMLPQAPDCVGAAAGATTCNGARTVDRTGSALLKQNEQTRIVGIRN